MTDEYTETYKNVTYLVRWVNNDCIYIYNGKTYANPNDLRNAINRILKDNVLRRLNNQ
jgi:hypothetical protein